MEEEAKSRLPIRLKKGLAIVSAITIGSIYGSCAVKNRPRPDPGTQTYGDRIFYGGGTTGKSDAGSLSPANWRFVPPSGERKAVAQKEIDAPIEDQSAKAKQ